MRKRYSRSYTVLSFLTMFSYRELPSGFLFVMLCHTHIFSGAVQPMRVMAFFRTDRAVSASFSRASSTGRSSPLMRQAV